MEKSMDFRTIDWVNGRIKIIDQRQLPGRLSYLHIKDLKRLWQAIKTLTVRGAPALGAAAALGVYLGVKNRSFKNFNDFERELKRVIGYIASSRPTAKNLFWALERIRRAGIKDPRRPVSEIKKAILAEAKKIMEEDIISCRKIGCFGAKLINHNDAILTICNAGSLATVGYGTALGVIYQAKKEGKKIKVYSCETRPILQGARLTTWELKKRGVDVTLICDNMAATLMQQGKIDKVITGADRIASNGDSANKIGTYDLAVLSRYHKVPFYVAAPASTFDLEVKHGKEIPIEQRPAEEIHSLFFKKRMAAKGIKVYNPAFDVTPASLITALITDKGILRAPFRESIRRMIP
ncbi:MAG: S-methyl-5-thioribose-1-phosphate isomerase [Candidatus Omnitrophica bacterium]|nr:S-methyl-5-thioribose-1-phosphate isomerase [Candidatus Omnitrophota bacterium]